jgi:hypothetical protein
MPQTIWRPHPFTDKPVYISNAQRVENLLRSRDGITKVEIMARTGITDNYYLNRLLKQIKAEVVGKDIGRNRQPIDLFGYNKVRITQQDDHATS